MQEYASTSQTPPPRLLVTIPSHFLNLPPKTIHARVFLNFTASPLQDFLLDAKSFSNPPPQIEPYMQEYSPIQDFLSRFQVIF